MTKLFAKKQCVVCSKWFRPKSHSEKSCSPECKLKRKRQVTERHQKNGPQQTRFCLYCGVSFQTTLRKPPNYCSVDCRKTRMRGDVTSYAFQEEPPDLVPVSDIHSDNPEIERALREFESRGGRIKKYHYENVPDPDMEEIQELLSDLSDVDGSINDLI